MTRPSLPAPILRDAAAGDAESIAGIYNHHVTATIVTFEEEEVPTGGMSRRVHEVQAAGFPWLVAESEGRVVGYAYATAWRPRHGYRFSAECTVYVAEGSAGRGIGSALYGELIERLRARGTHAIMAGIALPNAASIALHEKLGFTKVAHFRDAGTKFGRWIDVGYWQLILS